LKPLPIWKWAERNVSLPSNYATPGPFKVSRSRYLSAVFDALQDPSIREVTFRKATQTGGSMVSDILAAWVIRVNPWPMQINMQTDPDAKVHAQSRINPLLASCNAVAELFPTNRHHLATTEKFFQLMFLTIQGANENSLQSRSVCYQCNDEVVFWPAAGLTKDADRRLNAYSWRRTQYNVSQGGMEDDEFDKKYNAGTQEEYCWACPKCGMVQPFVWQYNNDPKEKGGMKYEENETTRPGGIDWDHDELAKTIYYECRDCEHRITDTPTERELLDRSATWIPSNKKAPASKRSFAFPAMACLEIPWADLVAEWVEAIASMKEGDTEPLKKFIQKRLAQSFKENIQFFEAKGSVHQDYYITEATDLSPGKFWADEHTRFLTFDMQLDHFWYVARAWSVDGRSRLIAEGRLLTELDIREKQIELGVNDTQVVGDSGFKATEVYMMCCIYGWRCLKGEDQRAFVWIDKKNNQKYFRPYSMPTKQEPVFGFSKAQMSRADMEHFQRNRKTRYATLSRWSNRHFNDLLQVLRGGKGVYWGIPSNSSPTYLEQLDGAQLRRRRNKQTNKVTWEWVPVGRRGDHLRDCELQQLVCAAFAGLLLGRDAPVVADQEEARG